ncbi:MAG: response regulator [Firmicutes bacterium]|nr:response regulator [Bacillota bacterium]
MTNPLKAPGEGARVLVLDDQEIIRLKLRRILEKSGYRVLEVAEAASAMEVIEREKVDLLLSDIQMPGMNGLELVQSLAHRIPEIAVVMVSGLDSVEMATDCLCHGAYGYVIKPFDPNSILIAVANALRRRMLEQEHLDREGLLARKVREQTEEIRASREEIAHRLLSASEHRDNQTGAHVRRIGLYAAAMARLLDWDMEAVDCIRAAAPMHDIGKIGVPDRVLQKEGSLTDEEWVLMRAHTTMGSTILRDSNVPFIQMGARIAACHHEWFDGTGYPLGLKGEEIPIEARIVTLLDVYDAVSSRRAYKEAWSEAQALEHLRSEAGKHFDPDLVELFLAHSDHFRRIFIAHPDAMILGGILI